MSIFNSIWLVINIILIIFILIRSPNEQSLQEVIGSFKFWSNFTNAEKTIDNFIQIFIILYFIIGFLLTLVSF